MTVVAKPNFAVAHHTFMSVTLTVVLLLPVVRMACGLLFLIMASLTVGRSKLSCWSMLKSVTVIANFHLNPQYTVWSVRILIMARRTANAPGKVLPVVYGL